MIALITALFSFALAVLILLRFLFLSSARLFRNLSVSISDELEDIIILAGKLENNQKEFLKLLQWFVSNSTLQFHIVIFCYFLLHFSRLLRGKALFAQCATRTICVSVKRGKSKKCFLQKNESQNSSDKI